MFKLSKRPSAPDSGLSVMHAANSSSGMLDIQRELIRVAFKDTLRNTGVPAAWLDCEVHHRPGPAGSTQVEVHLVYKRWSGHLLRYSQAFQHQFAQCMDRYEPTVDHSGMEWLWKFAPGCDNPFPTMPPAEEWAKKLEERKGKSEAAPAKPTAAAAADEKKSRAFELRDVFADLKA